MELDKAKLAHDWVMRFGKSGTIGGRCDTVKHAWNYADAMQDEADKRVVKGVPEQIEWQPDWSQAPMFGYQGNWKNSLSKRPEGEMVKEYLFEFNGKYSLVKRSAEYADGLPQYIEIPEGAEWAKLWDHGGRHQCVEFYRGENEFFSSSKKEWMRGSDQSKNMIGQPAYIVWQRHLKAESQVVDSVNKPQHYCSHPSGIECIEITQHHDFSVGNAIKYLWRAGLKGSDTEVQDLKKAVWYIENKIKLLESSDDI